MTLVILAAGMGSRFGGVKQMEPIDKDGNFIIDYSVFDAKRAGFDKVVFIIKEAIAEDFKATIGARVEKHIAVEYAYQEMTDIPEGYAIPAVREVNLTTEAAEYELEVILSEAGEEPDPTEPTDPEIPDGDTEVVLHFMKPDTWSTVNAYLHPTFSSFLQLTPVSATNKTITPSVSEHHLFIKKF